MSELQVNPVYDIAECSAWLRERGYDFPPAAHTLLSKYLSRHPEVTARDFIACWEGMLEFSDEARIKRPIAYAVGGAEPVQRYAQERLWKEAPAIDLMTMMATAKRPYVRMLGRLTMHRLAGRISQQAMEAHFPGLSWTKEGGYHQNWHGAADPPRVERLRVLLEKLDRSAAATVAQHRATPTGGTP